MRLTVSVVYYRSRAEWVEQSLRSLAAAVRALKLQQKSVNCHLCLIDNEAKQYEGVIIGRRLESSGELAIFDSLQFIVNQDNLGYGSAHNVSILIPPLKNNDFHLVLNPDVLLAQDALCEGLSYLLAHPEVSMVAPRACDESGNYICLCKRYPRISELFLRGMRYGRFGRWVGSGLARYEMRELERAGEAITVPIISGCFMLARRCSLWAVGGFDHRFFLYFEDFDLSVNVASQGLVKYLPTMKIIHYGGGVMKKGVSHIIMFASSAVKFFNKHGWRW